MNEEKLTREMLQLISGGEQANQEAEAFIKEMVKKYQVENRFYLLGKMTGEEVDKLFKLMQAGK